MTTFTLTDLERMIATKAQASPETSWTARLMAGGPERCAKKMGEEAIETALAAMGPETGPLIAESADLLYHLLVLLAVRGVALQDVMAELERRTGQSASARRRRAGRGESPACARETSAWTRKWPGPTRWMASRPIAGSRAMNGRGLRADTPLTLTAEDVAKLQSLNDPVSLDEVIAIYLPLSRLLSLYVAATQGCSARPSASCWPSRSTRCPTSSAWRARSRSASRPRRACSRRCCRAGPTRPRCSWSPPTGS